MISQAFFHLYLFWINFQKEREGERWRERERGERLG
jgi:hypothetical protein